MYDRFISIITRNISISVIILGANYLEGLFAPQGNLSMLLTLRLQIILHVRLRKYSGANWWLPHNRNINYQGIKKEAAHFNNYNGNTIWKSDTLKELESLMPMIVFKKLPSSLRKTMAGGNQFVPLCMIIDIKVDSRRKAMLVIGGGGLQLFQTRGR